MKLSFHIHVDDNVPIEQVRAPLGDILVRTTQLNGWVETSGAWADISRIMVGVGIPAKTIVEPHSAIPSTTRHEAALAAHGIAQAPGPAPQTLFGQPVQGPASVQPAEVTRSLPPVQTVNPFPPPPPAKAAPPPAPPPPATPPAGYFKHQDGKYWPIPAGYAGHDPAVPQGQPRPDDEDTHETTTDATTGVKTRKPRATKAEMEARRAAAAQAQQQQGPAPQPMPAPVAAPPYTPPPMPGSVPMTSAAPAPQNVVSLPIPGAQITHPQVPAPTPVPPMPQAQQPVPETPAVPLETFQEYLMNYESALPGIGYRVMNPLGFLQADQVPPDRRAEVIQRMNDIYVAHEDQAAAGD